MVKTSGSRGRGGGSSRGLGTKQGIEKEVSRERTELLELLGRKQSLADQLGEIERQIYKLETKYLDNLNPIGNALKGYDGFLSNVGTSSNKKQQPKPEANRLFSSSSVTGQTPEVVGR